RGSVGELQGPFVARLPLPARGERGNVGELRRLLAASLPLPACGERVGVRGCEFGRGHALQKIFQYSFNSQHNVVIPVAQYRETDPVEKVRSFGVVLRLVEM